MPTLDDLRLVLQERADVVADDGNAGTAGDASNAGDAGPGDVTTVIGLTLTGDVTTRRRHRLLATLLSAAAVVAVVAGVGAVAARVNHHAATPAAGTGVYPSRHMTWQFSIAPVRGWSITRNGSLWLTDPSGTQGAWQQGATIKPIAGGHEQASYTYEPDLDGLPYPGNGMGSAINAGHAVAVTVNGAVGWWSPGSRVDTSSLVPKVADDPWAAVTNWPDSQPELVWRNHDGSWNLLSGTIGFDPTTYGFHNRLARRTMLELARAVSIKHTNTQLTAPFAVALDSKFRPIRIAAAVGGAACVNWTSSAGTADQFPETEVLVCRASTAQLDDPKMSNDDVLHCPGGSYCPLSRRDLGDGTALIIGVANGALTAAQQRQLLDDADVSPAFAEPSTWLPV